MLSYKRSVRVAELLQQEISRILQENEIAGIGFVTVTGLKLTDDLQEARVFYSVLGTDEEIEASRKLLKEAVPSVRYQLAHRINLRRTPTIEFEYDETPSRATRVFELLNAIEAENAAPPPAGVRKRRPAAGRSKGRKARPK